ncbi:Fibrous sheath-interacting protein [Trichinella spiralis]|uniref:Fibrous sheath-interacting protein n=1 Tax=Trichinella spiralis TaxID=6334 RepID=A0ABR3KZA7_TRISP
MDVINEKDLVTKSKHLSRKIIETKKLSSEFFRSLEDVMKHVEIGASSDQSFEGIFHWGRSLGSTMNNVSETLVDVVDTKFTTVLEKLNLTMQQQKMDKKFIDVCNKRIRKNENYARKLKKKKAKKSNSGVACFNENVEISLNHQFVTFKEYLTDLLDRKNKVRRDSYNSLKDGVYRIFEQLSLCNVALEGLEKGYRKSSNIPELMDSNANGEAFSVVEKSNVVGDVENLENTKIDERTCTIKDNDFIVVRKDLRTDDAVLKECLNTREMMKSDANDEAFSVTENGALAMLESLEDTKIDERTSTINDDDFIFEQKNSCPCEATFKQWLKARKMMKSDANDEAFSVTENGALAMLESLEDTKIDERTSTINDDDFIFEQKNSCPCEATFKQCLKARKMMKSDANDEAFSVTENGALAMLESLEDTKIDERTSTINDDDFIFEQKNSCPCEATFKQCLKARKMMKSDANDEAFSVTENGALAMLESLEDTEIDERTCAINDYDFIFEREKLFASNEAFSATEEYAVEQMENLEDPGIDERTYKIDDEHCICEHRNCFACDTVFSKCSKTVIEYPAVLGQAMGPDVSGLNDRDAMMVNLLYAAAVEANQAKSSSPMQMPSSNFDMTQHTATKVTQPLVHPSLVVPPLSAGSLPHQVQSSLLVPPLSTGTLAHQVQPSLLVPPLSTGELTQQGQLLSAAPPLTTGRLAHQVQPSLLVPPLSTGRLTQQGQPLSAVPSLTTGRLIQQGQPLSAVPPSTTGRLTQQGQPLSAVPPSTAGRLTQPVQSSSVVQTSTADGLAKQLKPSLVAPPVVATAGRMTQQAQATSATSRIGISKSKPSPTTTIRRIYTPAPATTRRVTYIEKTPVYSRNVQPVSSATWNPRIVQQVQFRKVRPMSNFVNIPAPPSLPSYRQQRGQVSENSRILSGLMSASDLPTPPPLPFQLDGDPSLFPTPPPTGFQSEATTRTAKLPPRNPFQQIVAKSPLWK